MYIIYLYYIVSCFHESFKHYVLKQNNKQKKASVQTDVLSEHKIIKTIIKNKKKASR